MKSSAYRSMQLKIIIIFLVTATFSGVSDALEKAGHIIFSDGEITAINSGKTRHLKRGNSIYEGDVLKTKTNTTAQLRMTDGSLVALRPETEFSIDKYRFSKNSKTGNSVFNLIRGGFRTVSGWISKRNKKNYKVKTAIATIGIRGTHYGLTICTNGDCGMDNNGDVKDGLYGSVIDGEIYANNKSGTHTFSNDEYFYISSLDSKPQNLLKPPKVIFGQNRHKKLKNLKNIDQKIASMLQKRKFQKNDLFLSIIEHKKDFIRNQLIPRFEAIRDTNTSVNSFLEPTTAGNAISFSMFANTPDGVPNIIVDRVVNDGTNANQFFINAIAKEEGLFIPVAVKQTLASDGSIRTLFIGDAKPLEPRSVKIPNTDLAVGWGRWTNQYVATRNDTKIPHSGQLHYFVASDVTSLAQLGGLTGTATYTSIAGTRATDLTGNIAINPASVSMGVNFNNSSINTFNITTRVGDNPYQANITSPVAIDAALSTGLTLSGLPNGVCPRCSGRASISFLGPNAEGAGTVYAIGNSDINNAINGASILTR